jgi:Rod binding domain-containing protein
MTEILPSTLHGPIGQPERIEKLRDLSQELEAGFLAEMLEHSGLGAARQGFGGGSGEEQFASFLLREQARAMARAGGIGLAEMIFHSLARKSDAADQG